LRRVLAQARRQVQQPNKAMYKIIGADGREYGPVTSEQIRQWIAEGRTNAQTKVLPEGATEWQALGSVPEFADALTARPATIAPLTAPPPNIPGEVPFDRDYQLDIGGCIGRGWALLQSNFGTLFVASLIYFLIEGAAAALGAIPFIGPIFSLANWVIVGPLMGGLYWVFIQVNRGQQAGPGDVFAGFQKAFGNLFLGQLVPGLFAALCMLPALIVGLLTVLPALLKNRQPEPAMFIPVACVFLVCLLPAIFLTINWMFTLLLVIDKGLGFWPAMGASWKMVRKHWWQVFALMVVVAVLNLVGMALCCVGLLFSMPLTLGAIAQAYETIFGTGPAQTR
jgi:hypothetical protein